MGASPAAPAAAGAAAAESAAEAGAGAAMRASYETAGAASNGASQGASGASGFTEIGQAVMGPAQQGLSTLASAPSKLFEAPSSMMGPAQSAMGMFMNPGMLGGMNAGAAVNAMPGGSAVPVSGGVPGGGVAGGGVPGGGVMPSTYTKPVSAFEPGAGGRPVGLRPSGALGVEPVAANTVRGGAMGGGMPIAPMGHAMGGGRGAEDGRSGPVTAKVVDYRT
jgi:hypothetical protein